ncbi:MAG: alpha/beta fold hydrolase [Betaproteobacteria bacterium]|nr:alpha/beta fold hydrolase [Betaproteobacteria bacterium]
MEITPAATADVPEVATPSIPAFARTLAFYERASFAVNHPIPAVVRQEPLPVTLVLLPGLDGTDTYFEPLVQALPDWVRPLLVSYSSAPRQDYAGLLAHVRETIAHVPECHVLGWSFSGPLALMLANAEPDRVRSVILSATFVRSPHRMLAWTRFALSGPGVWIWRAGRRLPLWLFRPPGDPLRRAKTRTWYQVSARTIAARLRAILAVDARDALRTCRQPVVYLLSSDDGIVPGRNADEIVALRPAVRVVPIPGYHQAMYTQPVAAAQAIAGFLETTREARAE